MSGHFSPSKSEPVLWSLFSAGGVLAALFAPGVILAFVIMAPLGVIGPESLTVDRLAMLTRPFLVRLVLFGVVALTFVHGAHRFRFAVYDLGLKAARGGVAVLCYGTALVGSLWAARILLGLG